MFEKTVPYLRFIYVLLWLFWNVYHKLQKTVLKNIFTTKKITKTLYETFLKCFIKFKLEPSFLISIKRLKSGFINVLYVKMLMGPFYYYFFLKTSDLNPDKT